MSYSNCSVCNAGFGFFRWRETCHDCGVYICRDCRHLSEKEMDWRSSQYGRESYRCPSCHQKLLEIAERADGIPIVRGDRVGGHRVTEVSEQVTTRIRWRDSEFAKAELALNCVLAGANAVLNYRYERHKASEPSESGRGTHYYSVFTATGRFAVVESVEETRAQNLVECPACLRRVSKAAKACPKCGHPGPFGQ